MPHALLLSPDDQAVSAITGVLEEMSVTCERPLDGVSAAQKLNSQSFDLVLVDCENLPAAKLIFDVCRRGKNGHNPVPIAIVDGRAGLPTAFRLGAELILTKPVAKDQARSTIRTAVSRVRKDSPAAANASTSSANDLSINSGDEVRPNAASATAEGTSHSLHDSHALAGAPQVDAPQLTSFAESALGFVTAAGADGSSSPGAQASAATAATNRSVNAYMKEVKSKEQAEDLGLQITTPAESKAAAPPITVPAKSHSASPRLSDESTKIPLVMKPSDDPVLAEIDRSELEEDKKQSAAEKAETETAERAKKEQGEGEREHGSDLIPPPVQPKRNGMLAGTLMLALAGGGLYAVWNYQPEFRTMAQAQINHLLSQVGVEHANAVTPTPAKVQTIAVAPSASEVKTTNGAEQAVTVAPPDGTANSVASAAPPSVGAIAAASPAIADNSASTIAKSQNDSDKTVGGQPVKGQPVDLKAESKSSDHKSSDAKLVNSKFSTTPGSIKPTSASDASEPASASDAVILSSQGAQNRLIFSVKPKYPDEQRSRSAQEVMVLQTNVLANGKVGSVRLVKGNPTLADAAMDAVKQWRYRPYLRGGKAQPFQTVVIVDFQRP
jgi:TonB family protein